MKYIIPVLLFLSSCAMKPDVTEEQIAQYESCKKTLLENRSAFISRGTSEAKQDSLKDYIADIEKHNFIDLLQKYEVPQEQVAVFLFSICEKAERIERGSFDNVR